MRKWILSFYIGAVAGLLANPAMGASSDFQLPEGEIGRIHFCGTQKISADPAAAGFLAISALAPSGEWRERTIDKLSTAPYRLLKSRVERTSTNDFAPELRPLIVDLLENESFIESVDSTNAIPEILLAVRLPKDRADAWQTTLSNIIANWTAMTPAPLTGADYSGWQLKKHHSPDALVCAQSGDWTIFGFGNGSVQLFPEFVSRIQEQKTPVPSPRAFWLEAELNLSRILARHPDENITALLGANPPSAQLLVKGGTNYIRPELNLFFDQPLNLKLDPWVIPANLVQNNFISFAAARGMQNLLAGNSFFKQMQLPSVPSQFTAWARQGVPMELNVAFPVPGASNYLFSAKDGIIKAINSTAFKDSPSIQAQWSSNKITLGTFPLVGFYIKPEKSGDEDFVLTGLFPLAHPRVPKPMPDEMLHQFDSKPNLVAYSWEVTDFRMNQWRSTFGLNRMVHGQSGPPANAPGQNWMEQVHTNLAACATEFTLVAPNQIRILRNATVGLSGLELNLFELWLDSPGFPFAPDYPSVYSQRKPAPVPRAPRIPPGAAPPPGH